MMEIGARNRAVAETKMNERSSRSHSVLTVIVDGISHVTGQRTHGCLHLIDLAGQQSPFWCLSYAAGMSTSLTRMLLGLGVRSLLPGWRSLRKP